jgi:hypothetical protein
VRPIPDQLSPIALQFLDGAQRLFPRFCRRRQIIPSIHDISTGSAVLITTTVGTGQYGGAKARRRHTVDANGQVRRSAKTATGRNSTLQEKIVCVSAGRVERPRPSDRGAGCPSLMETASPRAQKQECMSWVAIKWSEAGAK